MKKIDFLLKQFSLACSFEELNLLYTRLNQKYQGDLAIALQFIAQANYSDNEVHYWLESAKTSDEFFFMTDSLTKVISKEYERRSNRSERKPASVS
jgi:hypothetical protein